VQSLGQILKKEKKKKPNVIINQKKKEFDGDRGSATPYYFRAWKKGRILSGDEGGKVRTGLHYERGE